MLLTPETDQVTSLSEDTPKNSPNGRVRTNPRPAWFQKAIKPLIYGLVLGVIAFVVCCFLPKKYQVVSTLYFPTAPGASILSSLSKGGTDGGGVSMDQNALLSPQVATSPQVAIALLNSSTCTQNVALDCKLPQIWKLSLSDTMTKLDGSSDFTIDKNGLLAITVTDTNPKLAVQIAQSFTHNLHKQADDTSNTMSHPNTQFIQDRITSVTADLRKRQKTLDTLESKTHTMPDIGAMTAEIATPPSPMAVGGGAASALGGAISAAGAGGGGGGANALLGIGSSTTSAAGSYVALQAEQARLEAAMKGTDAEIAKATEQEQIALNRGENVSAQVPVAMEARERLREIQAQLENDRKTLGPDNPTFRQDTLEVQTAQSEFNAEMQREKDALKMGIAPQLAELEAERSNEQAVLDHVNAQIKKSASNLAKLPSFQTHLLNLQYQVITDYEILKVQNANLELAIDAEKRDMPTFGVVDPPMIPDKAFFPKKGLTAGLAFFLGVLIGVLSQSWPTLRQQWRTGAEQA